MTAPYRTLLLAATCAALAAATSHASGVRLGMPAALEEPETQRHVDERSEFDAATTGRSALEARTLGAPRGLVSSRSDTDDLTGTNVEGDSKETWHPLGSIRADAWQVFSAMAVVVSLLVIFRAVLTRFAPGLSGGGRPSGVLEILARYPTARGQSLILIKLARRIILVHQNGSAMTALSEVTEVEEVAALLSRLEAGTASPRESMRFRSLLNMFSREHDRSKATSEPKMIRDVWDSGEVVDLTKGRGLAGMMSRTERADRT